MIVHRPKRKGLTLLAFESIRPFFYLQASDDFPVHYDSLNLL